MPGASSTRSPNRVLAIDTPGWEGILKHGMYHQRKAWRERECDVGDYFLLEALWSLMRDKG